QPNAPPRYWPPSSGIPSTSAPRMTPCANAASIEPSENAAPQNGLARRALNRNSNATPRKINAISISSTGRYSADNTSAYAFGNAASKPAPPSTSQVSFPSQIGAAVFIMWSSWPSSSANGARMPRPSTKPSSSTYISTPKPITPNQTTGDRKSTRLNSSHV